MADLVAVLARAMKERAAQPLGNIPSLEPVLVGSLGDAREVLVRAMLTALESAGYRAVPVEMTQQMFEAAAEEYCLWDSQDRAEWVLPSLYKAAIAAAPKVTDPEPEYTGISG